MRDLYLAIGQEERELVWHMDSQVDRLHYLSMTEQQREFFVQMREQEKEQNAEIDAILAEREAERQKKKAVREAEEAAREEKKKEDLKWKHIWTDAHSYMDEVAEDRAMMKELCDAERYKLARYEAGMEGPNPLQPRTRKKMHRGG